MTSAIALDTSPANVLRSMHGEIVAARIAHPDVLHVEVRDDAGGIWRLATQGAIYSPPEPADLTGRTICAADIDERSCELHCLLADGISLTVKPPGSATDDDLPYWELITPDGIALEFGPGVRWLIAAAD